ncbi:Taf3p [Lachancea thermotolerans CBS 6340]|uniref:KLTH0A02486p n=1 Tax=Lachancea thermotolerans (strain ATCC 56472 / CBS 6340 / NRRL Y-8284) TaxID=559295 RepID=C5DBG8_LACTC|nr:KLTH0A02486p [Lachancea thermotolerans CBS 6340]CAR21125.1 KLTH0A02486p [Lachancea thermotolerans CBS 6340]
MSTSNKEFHFGLLRISMIQLLKSHGFDKAQPSTVDAFTDLYVRFLQLLVLEVMKLSRSRMDEYEDIALQDISQALLNVGLLKPMSTLDVYDENPNLVSDIGMQKFKEWCLLSPIPKEARAVATPTSELLRPKDKLSKPLSMIPEYINQLDKGSAKDRVDSGQDNDIVEQLVRSGDMSDWTRFMIRRQQLMHARKISGREVKDIKSLPPVPGLRSSIFCRDRRFDNSEIMPPEPQETESDEKALKEKALITKLAAHQKDNRLDNIRLSFEEEDVDVSHDDIDLNDVNFDDNDLNEDMAAFEQMENSMNLTLGSENNLQLAEAENLNDTFQRRDSLEFGDEVFQGHEFDFNTY